MSAAPPSPAALITRAPVVPVIEIDDADQARWLAESLVAGGLPVMEVTLRTQAAPEAIARMRAVPGAIVGAGTLLSPGDVETACAAGAAFGVSPGATDALLDACAHAGLPVMPGAATASEMMRLMARGHELIKFFPAEALGGVAALKALSAPLRGLRFCPTGGMTPANAPAYLALEQVPCVGASWVAPRELIGRGERAAIEARAREAAALGTPA